MEKIIIIDIILGIWCLSRINASWWWYVVLIGVSVLLYIIVDNAKESNKDEKGEEK
jgi:hypothetical protein